MIRISILLLILIVFTAANQIICDRNQDCILNCTNSNPSNPSCSYITIDASQATQLTLFCNEESSCEYSNILCPLHSFCNIFCYGTYSCSDSFIHSNYSSTLNLFCSKDRSCLFTTVFGPKLSVNIDCSSSNSCGSSSFYLNNTLNITTKCHDSNNLPTCSTNLFYVNNANHVYFQFEGNSNNGHPNSIGNIIYGTYIKNTLIIQCNGYKCTRDLDVYCPLNASCIFNTNESHITDTFTDIVRFHIVNKSYNHLRINCTASSSICASSDERVIHCIDTDKSSIIGYDTMENKWYCFVNENNCCPSMFIKNNTINCHNGDCVIDCNDTNSSISCQFMTVNATLSHSLTIHCNHDNYGYGCHGSYILCPDSTCNIICNQHHSCQYMLIEGKSLQSFLLQCNSNNINPSYECKYMTVNTNMNKNANININCGDNWSSYSCIWSDITIEGNYNSGDVDINCIGSNSCKYSSWNIIAMNTISFDCQSRSVCELSMIHAISSQQFNILCDGTRACYNSDIHCPSNDIGSCSIQCADYGQSCRYLDVISLGNYTNRYLNIDCPLHPNGNNICNNMELHCGEDGGPYKQSVMDYNESKGIVSCSGNICCPLTPTQSPTYLPTMEPTIEPTTIPTIEPILNPTLNPTVDPSFNPTYNPTINPTTEPTWNPTKDPTTLNPTKKPTVDPTYYPTTVNPTTDPTFNPTINPTIKPTVNPTIISTITPTINPTTNPTVIPTTNPSYVPTSGPSTDPTTESTIYPSYISSIGPSAEVIVNPTTEPTVIQTANPTTNPSIAPTHQPTSNPTNLSIISTLTALQILSHDVEDKAEVLYLLLVLILIFNIILLILMFKYHNSSTNVDDQKYLYVILYFIQMFDIYSDIIFSVQIHEHYIYSSVEDKINNEITNSFYALFLSAIIFIIIPYIINFCSSIYIVSKISNDTMINNLTKTYFKNNGLIYSIGVLLGGGSFGTLQLLNSNLLGMKQFHCGLSTIQLQQFLAHKLFCTTFLQNIPQFIIQLYFMVKLGVITNTVIICCVSSIFNMLLTVIIVITLYITLTFKDDEEHPFIINISWKSLNINNNKDPYTKFGKRCKLSSELSMLLNMENDPFEFEVLSSNRKRNTAQIYGVIKVEKSYINKEEHIKQCFAKTDKIKQAIINAFEYDADFINICNFVVNMGTNKYVKDIYISKAMQVYLPQIWNEIDWNGIQTQNDGISNNIINELTEEVKQLTVNTNNHQIKTDDDMLYVTYRGDESMEIEMMKQVDLNSYVD